jgi:hypothetical protein
MVADLVRRRVSVIVISGRASAAVSAAKNETSTIPIAGCIAAIAHSRYWHFASGANSFNSRQLSAFCGNTRTVGFRHLRRV